MSVVCVDNAQKQRKFEDPRYKNQTFLGINFEKTVLRFLQFVRKLRGLTVLTYSAGNTLPTLATTDSILTSFGFWTTAGGVGACLAALFRTRTPRPVAATVGAGAAGVRAAAAAGAFACAVPVALDEFGAAERLVFLGAAVGVHSSSYSRAKIKTHTLHVQGTWIFNSGAYSHEPNVDKTFFPLPQCPCSLGIAYTVKASNFGPHGNFLPFLARSVVSLGISCSKNDQNVVCKSNDFL
jgi:hypothetical protein